MTAANPQSGDGSLRICERCGQPVFVQGAGPGGSVLCPNCATQAAPVAPTVFQAGPTGKKRGLFDGAIGYGISFVFYVVLLIVSWHLTWLTAQMVGPPGEIKVDVIGEEAPAIESGSADLQPMDASTPSLPALSPQETVAAAPIAVENIGMPRDTSIVAMELPPDTSLVGSGPTTSSAFASLSPGRGTAESGGGAGGTGAGFGGLVGEIGRRVGQAGGKSGDVQISLMWNNYNDIDLHIVCPHGERIFFAAKTSSCGGVLDVDMNAGGPDSNKPVENTVWPTGAAPPGHYQVFVHHFSNHGGKDPTPYTVRTVVRGKSQIYQGSVTPNQMRPICTFDVPAGPVIPPVLGGGAR